MDTNLQLPYGRVQPESRHAGVACLPRPSAISIHGSNTVVALQGVLKPPQDVIKAGCRQHCTPQLPLRHPSSLLLLSAVAVCRMVRTRSPHRQAQQLALPGHAPGASHTHVVSRTVTLVQVLGATCHSLHTQSTSHRTATGPSPSPSHGVHALKGGQRMAAGPALQHIAASGFSTLHQLGKQTGALPKGPHSCLCCQHTMHVVSTPYGEQHSTGRSTLPPAAAAAHALSEPPT